MAEVNKDSKSNTREEEVLTAGATHVEIEGLDAKAVVKIIEADSKAGKFGRASGFLFVMAGLILIILGFAGGTTFAMSLVSLSVRVNDAGPGVILAVVGLVLYYVYRPDVTIISKRK